MEGCQLVGSCNSSGRPDRSWGSRRAMRNADRGILFEDVMFCWKSRHLILNLTLSYKPEFHQLVTLHTVRKHRDIFLRSRRYNKLMADIKGCVWKIEEGSLGGGLHLHLIIFYSGEHHKDIHFTRLIGEYWVNVITQGVGDYYNSNADKFLHAMYGHGIGTGQIDRHDYAKREALRKNLLYLAKDEQQASKGDNPHLRMFGTSELPDLT